MYFLQFEGLFHGFDLVRPAWPCKSAAGEAAMLSCSSRISWELWTFRSQDHSLPGAKVPHLKLSLPGTFAPTNFNTGAIHSIT